jgi:nudix-type nucleoside diphosphatase (YffH/AdpP family)
MHHHSDRQPFAAGRPTPVGYESLRRSLAWGSLGRRAVVVARGPDAVRFVDNFTTAAISPLGEGEGVEGFFTDARGWVLALATILRTDDGVWIDAPAGVGTALQSHLEHYHIRERVELTDESSLHSHMVVAGPRAAAWLAARCVGSPPQGMLRHALVLLGDVPVAMVCIDWFGPEGYLLRVAAADESRLAGWLDAQGVVRMTDDDLHTARIEAGHPALVDIPEKTLPQEMARDRRAISFTKGCYLGQETVARIDALGHVNRRFVAVAIEGMHDQAPGEEVRSGDEIVGRITSACFSPALGRRLGLGFVQTKALAAAGPLAVAGAAARVVDMPLDVAAAVSVGDEPSTGAPPEDGELLLQTKRFRVVRVAEAAVEGERRQREVIRHPGSVVVVPFVSPREVCLVEVVRVAVGRTLLELPAGTLDRVESLEEAARRELAEETGYRAGRIVPAGAMWMSPGILRERMHLFVAENLVAGPQALEPGEQIRIRVVAWDEALAMCLDGRIDDAKTIAGLLLTAERRRQAGCGG